MNFTKEQQEKVLALTTQRIKAFAATLTMYEREQLTGIDPGLFAKIWQASALSMFDVKKALESPATPTPSDKSSEGEQ